MCMMTRGLCSDMVLQRTPSLFAKLFTVSLCRYLHNYWGIVGCPIRENRSQESKAGFKSPKKQPPAQTSNGVLYASNDRNDTTIREMYFKHRCATLANACTCGSMDGMHWWVSHSGVSFILSSFRLSIQVTHSG